MECKQLPKAATKCEKQKKAPARFTSPFTACGVRLSPTHVLWVHSALSHPPLITADALCRPEPRIRRHPPPCTPSSAALADGGASRRFASARSPRAVLHHRPLVCRHSRSCESKHLSLCVCRRVVFPRLPVPAALHILGTTRSRSNAH